MLRSNLLDLLRMDHKSCDRNGPRNFWRWVEKQPWRKMLPSPKEHFDLLDISVHFSVLKWCVSLIQCTCVTRTIEYVLGAQGAGCTSRPIGWREVSHRHMACALTIGSVFWFWFLCVHWRWIEMYIRPVNWYSTRSMNVVLVPIWGFHPSTSMTSSSFANVF